MFALRLLEIPLISLFSVCTLTPSSSHDSILLKLLFDKQPLPMRRLCEIHMRGFLNCRVVGLEAMGIFIIGAAANFVYIF